MNYKAGLIITVAFLFSGLARAQSAAPLRQGVSVELPRTQHAATVPAADDDTARVVAIGQNGNIYLGTEQTTPDALIETIRAHPFHKPASLFIKADARASYANIAKVLDPFRRAELDKFVSIVLLTGQDSVSALTPIPPTGLQVLLNRPVSASKPVVVKMPFPEAPARLTIDGDLVMREHLESELRNRIRTRGANLVVLNPGPQLRFSDVIAIIDTAKGLGATVVISAPML